MPGLSTPVGSPLGSRSVRSIASVQWNSTDRVHDSGTATRDAGCVEPDSSPSNTLSRHVGILLENNNTMVNSRFLLILLVFVWSRGEVSLSQTIPGPSYSLEQSATRRIDGDFPGGCCVFLGLRNDTVVCQPNTPERVTGGLWYWFTGRLTGPAGKIMIELHWPEDNEEYRKTLEYGSNQNFASVLDRTLNVSYDCRLWKPIPDVHVKGTVARFSVYKPTDCDSVYIAVGLPYFLAELRQLYSECEHSPHATVTKIVQTKGGSSVRAIRIGPADAGQGSFYLQALQHRTEWAGARILTSMVRFLLSEAGSDIRKKFVFHIVPVMDADGLSGNPRPGNMNRDWDTFSFPETRAVKDYLLQARSRGERLLHALDLHMGWSRRDSSVGCLTISSPGTVPDRIESLQRRFALYTYHRSNWTRERLWVADFRNGVSFSHWAQKTFDIPAQTAEFSRNLIWDRGLHTYVRVTQEHENQLGIDIARCLVEFEWDNRLDKD